MLASLTGPIPRMPVTVKFSQHQWVKRGHAKVIAGGHAATNLLAIAFHRTVLAFDALVRTVDRALIAGGMHPALLTAGEFAAAGIFATRIEETENEMRAILDKAIEEKRALSEEEQTEYDELRTKLEGLDKTFAQEEELAKREAQRATPATSVVPPDITPTPGVTAGEEREASKPFDSLGDQLLAIRELAMPGAGDVDKRLLKINDELRAATGMSVGVDADGGFAVQKDFAAAILGRVFDETPGSIMSRVRGIPLSATSNGLKMNAIKETSRANGSRWGGVQAYYAAEADTVTATKPKMRQIEMELHKLIAIWYMTDELVEDGVALGAVGEQAFAEEIQFKAEDSVVNGNGVGRPLGYMKSGALVTQAIEGSQTIANTAGSIAANTSKMLARFNGNIGRAIWAINREIFPKLALATLGGNSVPVYLPGGTIANAPFGTLWGIPLVPIEYASAEGTVGDIALIDLGHYLHIDKNAPKSAVSMHVRFLNGEQTFRLTYRHDGQPALNKPITPFKGSNTLSPFVTLAVRS